MLLTSCSSCGPCLQIFSCIKELNASTKANVTTQEMGEDIEVLDSVAAAKANVFQSKVYNPYEDIPLDSKNRNRLLFHGTCKSCLNSFKIKGVYPVWRSNEMSSSNAFYVTNLIEQAITHVFYTLPRLPHLDKDPIIILVFSVDITVLHGDRT